MIDALRRWPPGSTVVLAIVLGLSACGGDDDGRDGDGQLPPGSVATVDGEPLPQKAFDRRLAAMRRSQERPGQVGAEQLRQQAMSTLLQEAWLEREAERLGVAVSDAEVRARVAQAREQFPSRRAYDRFLGRQTEQDLRYQIRVQLLGEAIEEQLRRDGEDPQRVLRDLQERWAGTTSCRKGLVVPGCDGS